MRQGNMGRGRGRGRGSSGGPLMTDHLKIKNLDKELEMLRRKREVIQQEQQLLSMQCDFDRKRQFDCGQGRRIPTTYDNSWQPPPPKRFNAPQRKPWRDAGPEHPGPSMPQSVNPDLIPPLLSKKVEMPRPMLPFNQGDTPLLKPVVHPILKKTITVRKDFTPSKVLKNRLVGPGHNKLNSYTEEQRRDLILKTMSSKGGPEPPEIPILREDQIPTQQMTGRLELALGSLVKEIRYKNAHNKMFKSLVACSGPLRLLKQAIRERLRKVMINQPVGSIVDIIHRYRMIYKKEYDREIVELVLNSKYPKPVPVVESADPEKFFKMNASNIIERKFEEMFSNLLKMYTNARRKATLAYTKAAVDANKIDKPIEKGSIEEEILQAEKARKVIRNLAGKYISVEEQNALKEYYTDLIENILEEKITDILPKYIQYCAKIIDLDQEFKAVKFMTVKRVREENKEKKAAAKASNAQDMDETVVYEIDSQEEEEDDDEALYDKNNEAYNEGSQAENDNEVINSKETEQEAMDGVDTEVPNPKDPQIIELDNEGEVSQEEEANEVHDDVSNTQNSKDEETNKMEAEAADKVPQKDSATEKTSMEEATVEKTSVETIADKKDDSTQATPITKAAESSTTRRTPTTPSIPSTKEFPYYVKLIGRPNLPPRAVICDFLNNYRPKSIKKHKSINNLLVVGFIDKDDFSKILAANETVLGDTTIIIKASEPVNPSNEAQKAQQIINQKKDDQKDTEQKQDDQNDTEQKKDDQNDTEQKKDDQNDTEQKKDDQNDTDPKNVLTSTNIIADGGVTNTENPEGATEKTLPSFESTDTEVSKESTECQESRQIETIKEVDENNDSQESVKPDKGVKGNLKESGRATPVRSSSRLANVTPSTIRTRRASRLVQE